MLAISISSGPVTKAVVWIVILALIWGLVVYFKTPQPFRKFLEIVLVGGAFLILIWLLLTSTGTSLP